MSDQTIDPHSDAPSPPPSRAAAVTTTTNRRSLRVPYTCDRIELNIDIDGDAKQLTATGRNISKGGLGLLVEQALPEDTACVLRFPKLTGQICEMPSKIYHCKPVHGELHEVGVIFEHEIDLEAFVTLQRVQRMIYMKEKQAAAAALKAAQPADATPKAKGTSAGGQAIVSKLANQPGMAEKLDVYLKELGQRAEQLTQALEAENQQAMLDHAEWLVETGQPHGFPTLTAVANVVSSYLEDIVDEEDLSTVHTQVQQLIGYMRRAQPGQG